MPGIDEVHWARRAPQDKIRRLYTLDAKGIVDEDLINDVGYAMYARCESIRLATEAHYGRVTCPRCRSTLQHRWDQNQSLVCACGWETTWGAYLKIYQGKQLFGGTGRRAFFDFLERWPKARTPRDKRLTIDRLIHACHPGPDDPERGFARPAATNLIEGTARQLIRFLDELAYGDQSTSELQQERDRWRAYLGESVLRRVRS